MTIKNEWPPNIEKIRAVFDLSGKKPVFTWGEILYNPHNCEIPEHLKIHEEIHSKQQVNPEVWWKRYLEDDKFRLEQELEAYQAQYQYIKRLVKDRNTVAKFLYAIASDLASPMYGGIISFDEAYKKIKQ